MYSESVGGVLTRLLFRTRNHSPPLGRLGLDPGADGGGLMYIAELINDQLSHKMDHLVCFLPGLLALGAANGAKALVHRDLSLPDEEIGDSELMKIAGELTRTCVEMYTRTPTGLAPEIAFFISGRPARVQRTRHYETEETQPLPDLERFKLGGAPHIFSSSSSLAPKLRLHGQTAVDGDFSIKVNDAHNLLRPETVESLFIMWRLTGDEKYRNWGWQIWKAFERHCRVSTGGYTSMHNVFQDPSSLTSKDKMESFFLAETLKYLFLLFSDDHNFMSLKEYVFNTEAHPFPILGSMSWQE